jgi:hypothetical protein
LCLAQLDAAGRTSSSPNANSRAAPLLSQHATRQDSNCNATDSRCGDPGLRDPKASGCSYAVERCNGGIGATVLLVDPVVTLMIDHWSKQKGHMFGKIWTWSASSLKPSTRT